MEFFETGAKIFKDLGVGPSLVFALLIIVIGGGGFYLKMIYPKKMEAEQRREQEGLACEERRASERKESHELLKDTVNKQNEFLVANTQVVDRLGDSLRMLNQTFEKVSDRLSSHDERSIYLTQMVQAQTLSIAALTEKVPNNESILRVHSRIDEMTKDTADKSDVTLICAAITKLDMNIGKVSEGIAELKGRSLSQ